MTLSTTAAATVSGSPQLATRLAPIDLAIVALYLIAITIFGLRFSRREKSGGAAGKSLKSYFLAGNTIPWWAIALSIVSAETSTLTIVSVPGVAFAGNFGFLQIVLGYMIGRVVVAALFLPRYFRGEMLTAYQLIDQRFGHTLHKVTAGLFLLTRAAAEGVRVFAISIVVGIAIGTGDVLSIGIISALTLLYTFEGGLAAVIWTDVLQMALYVGGTVVALFTLGAQVPGGWGHIHAVAAPLGKFHMLDFSFSLAKSYTFWAGILGGTFLTMASHGTDQLMVQRMLAARNLRDSRLALLSSGAVIFLQFTLFLLIGVGLYVFYAAHPGTVFRSNDHIFPTFIVQRLPHGIAGLLVAAILAAAMSNLSAALNSLASTTVMDFYLPFRNRKARPQEVVILNEVKDPRILSMKRTSPDHGSHQTPRIASEPALNSATNTTLVSRISTIAWALVLFALAVYSIRAGGKGHVVETGLSIASVAYGSLLGVFLLGTLTRYATELGAILGMICGFTLNLALWQFPTGTIVFHPGTPGAVTLAMPHIAFTWYVLIGAVVTFATGSLFSLIPTRKRILATAAILFTLTLPFLSSRSEAQGSAVASATPGPDFTPVSNLITQAIAQKKIPGAVVIIGHDGRVVFKQAYGSRKLAGELSPDGSTAAEPMTEDTLFDMASLSKVLTTTTSVLQLIEQHKIALDAPVAQYLPDFAANGKGRITVRELLTHNSGLPEDVDLKDAWGLTTPDKAEGIRRAMNATPYGPPGTAFRYSDINFITLGALVEKVSGQTLDAYARERIFNPLALLQTAYHPFDRTCGPAIHTGAAISPGPRPVGRIGIACQPGTWSPLALDPDTAPTAHDNEGSPDTNPDFDHLLRGTVHDPTTRRMGGVAGHAGVFSTADDAARFCQALLDKLLHNTGPFPLSQATLRMATSPQQPATAQANATIFNQDGTTIKGVAERGLGWDINSPFSRPRGTLFPLGKSFGHTGFTGTSLWLDPTTDTYVVLLSNAIHPRGAPPISTLRGDVATAAAKALQGSGVPHDHASAASVIVGGGMAQPRVQTGIDVLEQTHYAALTALASKHNGRLRLALLTNQSGVDAQGRRTVDLLLHADPSLQLTTLFSPEHGLYGRQDTDHLAAEQDAATHLPVISLYGPKSADKHPKPADLKQLDAVVIDLQDAGVRFWTYETLLGYMLESCARAHVEVIVLDRPNPIGGEAVQGETSDLGMENYTDFMPLPLRHGMTFGELARYFNGEALPPGLRADLTVVSMQGWHRADYFDATGLPWLPPSPNLKTLAATVLYPGVGLTEQTNLSVGRGTATPFESLGAPWIDAAQLSAYLTARHIAGITFSAGSMMIAETPERYPFYGQTMQAVHFEVTDCRSLNSPELGVELLAALHHLYPEEFQLQRAKNLVANAETLAALEAGRDPADIAAQWRASLASFTQRRETYLLYR